LPGGGGGGGGGIEPLSPPVPLSAVTIEPDPLRLLGLCAGQAKASHNAKNMFSIFKKFKR